MEENVEATKIQPPDDIAVAIYSYKILMEANNQSVIVGFIDCNVLSPKMVYPLTYDLSNSSFSLRMRDDITRVACEYAVTEYVGYHISEK